MEEHECKYISSMGFRKSCPVTSLMDTTHIYEYDFSQIKENDLVYIKTDKLIEFSKILSDIDKKFVLVSGCSDYTLPFDIFSSDNSFFNFINSDQIIHWYAQNCIISHPKITQLPIGMDYHTLHNSTMKWGKKMLPIHQEKLLENIKKIAKPFWEREYKIYSNCHFQMDTKYGYDRKEALNQIPNDLIYYESKYKERKLTWMTQIQYAFSLSPHGNGLDCHRTWEIIILGGIPIVKTSPLDKLYENLPVLIVNEWSDISSILLLNTIHHFQNKLFQYEKLTMEYWLHSMKSH
jgi:hypothetical protein